MESTLTDIESTLTDPDLSDIINSCDMATQTETVCCATIGTQTDPKYTKEATTSTVTLVSKRSKRTQTKFKRSTKGKCLQFPTPKKKRKIVMKTAST